MCFLYSGGLSAPLQAPTDSNPPSTSQLLSRPPPDSDSVHPTLNLIRIQRKISGTQSFTVWYEDTSPNLLEQPCLSPDNGQLEDGDLYLHANSYRVRGIWMRVRENNYPRWLRVSPGTRHPTLANRFLFITDSQIPSWVKGETLSRYSRKKSRKSDLTLIICHVTTSILGLS
jgi:hypothetical protein